MSQVIRYVHLEGDVVVIRKSFLGFFSTSGKTPNDISNDILKTLENDGLIRAL